MVACNCNLALFISPMASRQLKRKISVITLEKKLEVIAELKICGSCSSVQKALQFLDHIY